MAKQKRTPARKPAGKGRAAKKPPFDVYQAVTDRILELLDAGTVPWHNPIRGAAADFPKNLASGKPYRGVNVFLLAMTALAKGYDSPWWVTFRQAKERGGSVKKGEKSTMVVFWKKLLKDDEEPKLGPDGKPERPPFVLRYYNVFNAAAQCEGLSVPQPPDLATVPEFVKLDEAERVVREYRDPPMIEHHGTQAAYAPKLDRVRLPVPERFESREDYYGTLFHELIHSTGIKGRCDRGLTENPPPFGTPDYSKEELVAEMGAAFLNAVAGIGHQTIASSASYIDGWRKKLRSDNKLVVQAAGQAQNAADHILGVQWGEAAKGNDDAPGQTLAPVHTVTPAQSPPPNGGDNRPLGPQLSLFGS
ncbi:MAG: ArdC-like ssDNA-binding domain-containing protein [Bacteroidota bacterium]